VRFAEATVGLLAIATTVGVFILLTRARNADYQSALAFWRDAVDKDPNNSTALGNLGILEVQAGNLQEAETHLSRSLQRRPINGPAHVAMGKVFQQTGRLPEAIHHFRQACEQAPRTGGDSYISLAMALLAQRNVDEAISVLRRGVELIPWEPRLRLVLGTITMRSNPSEAAEQMIAKAIAEDSDPTHARTVAGQLFAQLGMPERAIDQFRQAAAAGSQQAPTYIQLAILLEQQGQTAEAARHYQTALIFAPDQLLVLNNLGWILATARDEKVRNGAEAVRLGERAAELTNRADANVLDTLAAAYAEVGRFDLAVSTIERAIQLRGNNPADSSLREMRSRLDLYRGGKPFRG
jgi:Flp pilus assembly protein TadD